MQPNDINTSDTDRKRILYIWNRDDHVSALKSFVLSAQYFHEGKQINAAFIQMFKYISYVIFKSITTQLKLNDK